MGWGTVSKDDMPRLQRMGLLLYPQYDGNFNKVLDAETHGRLVELAKEKLNDHHDEQVSPAVLARWKLLASGQLPPGWRLENPPTPED